MRHEPPARGEAKHCHRCGVKVVSATEPTEKPETPPTPTNPKRTTPIPSQRHTAETNNMTALKSAPEKPIPAPKPPQTVEAAKPIEMPSTPKTPQPVRPEFELRILRETSKDVVEEQEIEWEPDEDLYETLKAMRVDPREFKHEAVWLAASNLDEREFEKELIRSADRLVSRVEGLDPDGRDALRLSLCKHLRDSVYEIKKLMRAPELPMGREKHRIVRQAPIDVEFPRAPGRMPQEKEFLKTKPRQWISMVELALELGVKGYVLFVDLIQGKIKPKTAYLLPIERSAVPTDLIVKQMDIIVENVEKLMYGDKLKIVPASSVFALTRIASRKDLKIAEYSPSPTLPYIRKFIRIVEDGIGDVFIITVEMYMIEEVRRALIKRGFEAMLVMFDEESAREELEKITHPKRAARCAKLAAMIPWLTHELAKNGFEGVKRKLHLFLDPFDRDEVFETIEKAFSEDYPDYPNRLLAKSLGVLEDERGRNWPKFDGTIEKLAITLYPYVVHLFICLSLSSIIGF
jgi:hypothetical protein